MTSITKDGKVRFRFFRPGAGQVNIVGDFNAWRSDALRMQPDGEGWWQAETRLNGGDYRFRYLADGAWYADYAANGIELDKFGCTSLLAIPEASVRAVVYDAKHVA